MTQTFDIIYPIQYSLASKLAFETDTSSDSTFRMFCMLRIFLPLWLTVNPSEISDLRGIICQTRAETKCWFQRVKLSLPLKAVFI